MALTVVKVHKTHIGTICISKVRDILYGTESREDRVFKNFGATLASNFTYNWGVPLATKFTYKKRSGGRGGFGVDDLLLFKRNKF